ncbi:nicotinate phosphoribosyltransferase, partial [Buchnera aphidicola]|nr:nicotinate phosphoribosyltransferase [Buchnera aphidicola]
MRKYNSPIIKTLLDNDAYKFYMQQAVFYYYKDVSIVADFICRGDNFLGSYANVILEQINMMTNLSLSHKEYVYMASFSLFQKEYLFYLKNFRYNLSQITVKNQAGKLYIRISGLWKDVILWEVPILAIVSEVFHSHSSPKITPQCAIRFLDSKLFNFFHY